MISSPRYVVVEAPESLGLSQSGVERLPGALLDAGLADALGAPVQRLGMPSRSGAIDVATGVLNATQIAAYAAQVAGVIGDVLENGARPVLLAGDCSAMLGPLLALRRRGRAGLLFVDGHTDFYSPAREPRGEAASVDLALATGRGPPLLADLDRLGPLVRDEDVVLLGPRDATCDPDYAADPVPPGMLLMGADEVRRIGGGGSVAAALDRLGCADGPDQIWLHLDADVLDDRAMPAVDYRMPGGLAWDEVEAIVAGAARHERMAGLSVAILNPELDPSGELAARLGAMLARALA